MSKKFNLFNKEQFDVLELLFASKNLHDISGSGGLRCFVQVSFCFKKHLPSDLNFPNLFLCNLSKKFEVTRKWTIKAGRRVPDSF